MYETLANELYDYFRDIEHRKGRTDIIMADIQNNPDKYPGLCEVYNFTRPKERGYFHILLKIIGIRIRPTRDHKTGTFYKYTVPPAYWFIHPGKEQADIIQTVLPHHQPVYRQEIRDIISYMFPGKAFVERRTIKERMSEDWPHIKASLDCNGNDVILSTELKKLGCTVWSRHPRNTIYRLPDGYWQEATA